MIELQEALKIADIHAERLQMAAEEIDFPLSVKKLENLSLHDLGIFELYTSRFAKLQDHMGSNIFPLLLKELQ